MNGLVPIALVLLLAPPLAASLWDRDSIAADAAPLPEARALLAGHIPRYPPEYYEVRLKRCAEVIKADPKALEEYDDAAAACFRLERYDEAIHWMQQKETALPAVLQTLDAGRVRLQTYRMHCNLATFYTHRWAKSGAERGKLRDVIEARNQLVAAFSKYDDIAAVRDRYHYKLIEAILKGGNAGAMSRSLPDMFGLYPRVIYGMNRQDIANAGINPAEARQALTALIAHGGEDESIDLHFALALALAADGRMEQCFLALWRATELADGGRLSWMTPALKGAALKAALKSSAPATFGDNQAKYDKELDRLAGEAKTWNAGRNTFLLNEIALGRHPDTDADFWKGYETPKIVEPARSGGMGNTMLIPAIALGLLVLIGGGFAVYLMIRRHQAIPTVKDI